MSFDEKQHLDNDEVDLAQLFRSIWFYKFSLLLFIIFSVPLSIGVSTILKPTYKAETVFEKPRNENLQRNTSLLNGSEGLGFLALLGGGPNSGAGNTFFSEIRSESFLKTVILNNPEIDSEMLLEFCPLPSKEISRFSLRALPIALRISENRTPSESQKDSLLVKCVNEMLEIKFDSYGSSESSAFRLSIESEDPNFSANLANQIVEKYFVRHEKVKDKDFQNVKNYLLKVITEYQQEFTEANKLMQSFIIKHTLLMNIEPFALDQNSDVGLPLPPSPFAAKLNKDFFSLSQLEKFLSQLKQAKLKLSNLKELDQNEIEKATSSTEIQEVLSRTFFTSVSKIANLSAGTSVINEEIKKIVSQELQNLRQQIRALEKKISIREAKTRQLLTIENRFQDLAIDVAKKKLLFEGLKDQLKEKILVTGLANVKQPVLLTKAVPPFVKAFPNKKLILATGIVISVFAGIAYILIRQRSLRRVHSLSQIRRLSSFSSCYEIKYKQLKMMGINRDETVIGQSFFSRAKEMGKLGCIIDLSKKINNNSLASEFSKIIVSLFATDNSKIVCLDASQSKKTFSTSAQKNFVDNRSDYNRQEILSESNFSSNDEEAMISAGEVKEIKNKYSDYDKIVCVLGAEIGDLTKFKFIEQCDFYVLIGRSFHFDEYTYKRFSNTVWEKGKKCLGFFLIG